MWSSCKGPRAEVSRDWLLRNHQVLLAHPESGCVGGVVEQVHGSKVSQRIGSAMSTPFGVGDAKFRTGGSAGHVDTVAFGAYRRDALEEIGLFDVALSRNQDDELNYRLLKSGWRIWFDPHFRNAVSGRPTETSCGSTISMVIGKSLSTSNTAPSPRGAKRFPHSFCWCCWERVPAGWRKLWATGTAYVEWFWSVHLRLLALSLARFGRRVCHCLCRVVPRRAGHHPGPMR